MEQLLVMTLLRRCDSRMVMYVLSSSFDNVLHSVALQPVDVPRIEMADLEGNSVSSSVIIHTVRYMSSVDCRYRTWLPQRSTIKNGRLYNCNT